MRALAAERFSQATSPPQRRYELDWLRVLAVLGLIPFHVAIIFSLGEKDYISSAQSSPLLDAVAVFVTFWGIPLLFLVGGASAWFALGSRTPRRYLKERTTRLLIPFLFGVLTVVPIQVYFGRLGEPSFHASFWQFYPEYFLAFTPDKGPDYWAHLWFIPCLLVFSVITLPLFVYLRGEAGGRFVARLAAACERPGVILLFGLPLGIADMALNAKPVVTLLTMYLNFSNWSLFFVFLIFFVYGYLLYADPRIESAVRHHGISACTLGLVGLLAAQLVLTPYLRQPSDQPGYDVSVAYVTAMLLRGFISWLWIVTLVSLAMHVMTFTNGLLRYLNEAFYPVYVLHMTALTAVGYFVVQWPTGIWVKYIVIVVATVIITFAIYDILISRFNVMRYLFGLKPKATSTARAMTSSKREVRPRDAAGTGSAHREA